MIMTKNIHILPTQNNKSKLAVYHYDGSENIKVGELGLQINNIIGWSNCWSPRELYITSDEVIKEKDYFYQGFDRCIHKCYKLTDNYIIAEKPSDYPKNICKKIILTTDKLLIKDGVQAIDDEFLGWFAKNLSC